MAPPSSNFNVGGPTHRGGSRRQDRRSPPPTPGAPNRGPEPDVESPPARLQAEPGEATYASVVQNLPIQIQIFLFPISHVWGSWVGWGSQLLQNLESRRPRTKRGLWRIHLQWKYSTSRFCWQKNYFFRFPRMLLIQICLCPQRKVII